MNRYMFSNLYSSCCDDGELLKVLRKSHMFNKPNVVNLRDLKNKIYLYKQ